MRSFSAVPEMISQTSIGARASLAAGTSAVRETIGFLRVALPYIMFYLKARARFGKEQAEKIINDLEKSLGNIK